MASFPRLTESVRMYVMSPRSYSAWASPIVRFTPNPRYVLAACCSEDVVKGAGGLVLVGLSSRLTTLRGARCRGVGVGLVYGCGCGCGYGARHPPAPSPQPRGARLKGGASTPVYPREPGGGRPGFLRTPPATTALGMGLEIGYGGGGGPRDGAQCWGKPRERAQGWAQG